MVMEVSAANGTVSYYWQFYMDNNNNHNYAMIGSRSLTSVANGTARTHHHHLLGTQANGAAITQISSTQISGGHVGDGGTNALQSGAPSNGGNGTAGSVVMTL